MATSEARRRKYALTQLAVAIIVGVVVAAAAGVTGWWRFAALVGWDATALIYVGWTWATIWRMDPRHTATHASATDPTRAGSDLLLLCASAASLIAVGLVIVHAAQQSGLAKALETVLGIGSVLVAWMVVHTTYTLRYAKLFHDDPVGGVDFHNDDDPDYGDFAYLAFTIGMTFQVSDTDLTGRPMRRTALRHALLSYLYGTIIIATTINIVAGLTK